MSENGPREGTRDMARPGPDAGRRSVESDSPAGIAYSSLARSLRRRREELRALAEAGRSEAAIAESYQKEHPLEPVVTFDEVRMALAPRKPKVAPTPTRRGDEQRSQVRKRNLIR